MEDNGRLAGWNVLAGGGMGMTHGEKATYPRLADLLGFCTPEQAIAVAEQIPTAITRLRPAAASRNAKNAIAV